MPEVLRTVVSRVRSRLRLRGVAHAVTIGGAIFAALIVASAPVAIALLLAIVIAMLAAARHWRIDAADVARVIEAAQPLDNLLVSAVEIDDRPRPVRGEIREAIFEQAAARAAAVIPSRIVTLRQPVAVATAVLAGCLLLARSGDVTQILHDRLTERAIPPSASNAITVRITPPAYTRKPVEVLDSPPQVTVMAGSTVRVDTGSRILREWVANVSESLDLQVQANAPSRFLSVIVVPDVPPSVRITEPGRDTARATGSGSIRVAVETRDDLGLSSLSLRYTKASGGGENVTFAEGDVPLTLERVSERHWRSTAQWTLDPLALAEGDVLVYRAIARDGNPDGEAVESDAFLIEIGRTAEIASAGFALPTEERKYAISQQMVIYKTEQLLASRGEHKDDWLEQTRMLGVEQRMVRAEVVFLSGGEVQDEVEEAAHSHELAEGRLENQGRAEMVRALNFMSRAEAQLNDGNAVEALVFERQALASLERALDRRRYFLRTLPDRSRIDLTRRLTGERREARSWLRPRADPAIGASDPLQTAMRDLIAALSDPSQANASLAARVAAVEPDSPALQKAAVAIANAQSADERAGAVRAAMQAVTAHAIATLPGSSAVHLPGDPLAGRLREAMTRPPQ